MFKALLKKQFLELYSFYFQNKKTGKLRTRVGIIGMALLFAFVFLSVGFAFFGMAMLFSSKMVPLGLDWLYFAIMGIISVFVGIIGGVLSTYTGLYNAKDNELLLSLPIPTSTILLTRMISIYVIGLLYEALVFIPAIIAYWMAKTPTALSVVFSLLIVFVIGFLVLTLSCFLGYLVALAASHVKNKSFISVLMSLALIMVYYVCYFRINTFLMAVVNNADKVSNAVKTYIYLFYQMGLAASGNIVSMLIFTLTVALLCALLMLILSKSFIKIVTMKKGEKKSAYKKQALKSSSVKSTLLKKEIIHFLASPAYILNSGFGILILIIGAGAALIKSQAIRGALAAFSISNSVMALGIASVVGFIAAMDCISAPSVSLEGKNIWIVQSLPVNIIDVLDAKQRLHIMLNIVPAVICTLILGIVLNIGVTTLLMILVFEGCLIMFNSAVGIMSNLKKPNLSWTNETVPIKQGISVVITMLLNHSVIIIFAVVGFLVRKIINIDFYILVFAVLLSSATRVINGWIKSKGVDIFETL